MRMARKVARGYVAPSLGEYIKVNEIKVNKLIRYKYNLDFLK